MAYRPPKKLPQFADLKGILSQSKQTDNALYQTVSVLIDRLTQFQGVNSEQLSTINGKINELASQAPGSEGGDGGGEPVPMVATHYDSPLTDGHLTETELIFASGDCIIVQIPI